MILSSIFKTKFQKGFHLHFLKFSSKYLQNKKKYSIKSENIFKSIFTSIYHLTIQVANFNQRIGENEIERSLSYTKKYKIKGHLGIKLGTNCQVST